MKTGAMQRCVAEILAKAKELREVRGGPRTCALPARKSGLWRPNKPTHTQV